MNNYIERSSRYEFKTSDKYGKVIGMDGYEYDTESEAFYFGQLRLCGCGCPAKVHQFLIDCMSSKNDEYPNIVDLKKVAEVIKSQPEVVAEFVLHILEERDLTEHGGSVYSSWLTDRGEQLVEAGAME